MFVHTLALRLHMPVGTMLAQMSSTDLTMWQAYCDVLAEDADAARLKEAIRGRNG